MGSFLAKVTQNNFSEPSVKKPIDEGIDDIVDEDGPCHYWQHSGYDGSWRSDESSLYRRPNGDGQMREITKNECQANGESNFCNFV